MPPTIDKEGFPKPGEDVRLQREGPTSNQVLDTRDPLGE
jgi:hypothetical protein